LPRATAMFRSQPSWPMRRIAVPSVRARNAASSQANSASRVSVSRPLRGRKSVSSVRLAKRFHGHASRPREALARRHEVKQRLRWPFAPAGKCSGRDLRLEAADGRLRPLGGLSGRGRQRQEPTQSGHLRSSTADLRSNTSPKLESPKPCGLA
jgi:hypothetical protein